MIVGKSKRFGYPIFRSKIVDIDYSYAGEILAGYTFRVHSIKTEDFILVDRYESRLDVLLYRENCSDVDATDDVLSLPVGINYDCSNALNWYKDYMNSRGGFDIFLNCDYYSDNFPICHEIIEVPTFITYKHIKYRHRAWSSVSGDNKAFVCDGFRIVLHSYFDFSVSCVFCEKLFYLKSIKELLGG